MYGNRLCMVLEPLIQKIWLPVRFIIISPSRKEKKKNWGHQKMTNRLTSSIFALET
jgi:hypothetical protein